MSDVPPVFDVLYKLWGQMILQEDPNEVSFA